MRNKWMLILVALCTLVVSGSAFAHHGAIAYDAANPVTVTGTLTEFQFVNPHVLIWIDVKDPATGKIVKWGGELTSPNHLVRAGWSKNTFKPGDQVTMTGSPSKTGAPSMAIRKIMKDGQPVSLGGDGDN